MFPKINITTPRANPTRQAKIGSVTFYCSYRSKKTDVSAIHFTLYPLPSLLCSTFQASFWFPASHGFRFEEKLLQENLVTRENSRSLLFIFHGIVLIEGAVEK